MAWTLIKHRVKFVFTCKIWGFHGDDYEEWCLLSQKTPFFFVFPLLLLLLLSSQSSIKLFLVSKWWSLPLCFLLFSSLLLVLTLHLSFELLNNHVHK
jgi:hypothetical protein